MKPRELVWKEPVDWVQFSETQKTCKRGFNFTIQLAQSATQHMVHSTYMLRILFWQHLFWNVISIKCIIQIISFAHFVIIWHNTAKCCLKKALEKAAFGTHTLLARSWLMNLVQDVIRTKLATVGGETGRLGPLGTLCYT